MVFCTNDLYSEILPLKIYSAQIILQPIQVCKNLSDEILSIKTHYEKIFLKKDQKSITSLSYLIKKRL